MQLQWLFDFYPGLLGMFEDQISFQKRNQSWNEFEIGFVRDFLTWCTPNPLLAIAGRNILARLASVFCTYSNKHILEWFWWSNFVLENAISFLRVIVEWSFRGWDNELKRLQWWNFRIIPNRQAFNAPCSFWALPSPVDDAFRGAFDVKLEFRQDRKQKNGNFNFFSFGDAQCSECKEVARLT